MEPTNLVILMSDEHSRHLLGGLGNPLAPTPNLDRLAARGTSFSQAYCTSPLCIPSRASLATGLYTFQHRCWDNAAPYDGSIPAWGHRAQAAGHRAQSIGKLSYRELHAANGFDEEIYPLPLADGVGDLLGLIRDELPQRKKYRDYVVGAGPRETKYTLYDRRVAEAAVRWLHEQAPRYAAKPWVLYVGFFCPHPPFNAPPEFFERVRDLDVPWPVQHGGRCRPHHPAVEDLIRSFGFDGFDDATVRNAIRAYYALVAFVDDNVGQVLRALEETGLDRTTRTLYTTDHGESLGNRGLWGKFTLYEESAGVPLILRGPGVPAGQVCATPVTLADVFPTVLESLGVEPTPQDRALPGHSLLATARGALPRRPVVAEYHALGSRGANFMIRRGAYKYIHHVRYAPQLFDLAEDPEELHDLAAEPRFRDVREVCAADLRAVLDPAAVDARCKADQARMIARHGGREAILARGEGSGTQIPPELARTA